VRCQVWTLDMSNVQTWHLYLLRRNHGKLLYE
jgi:hypothetical protein